MDNPPLVDKRQSSEHIAHNPPDLPRRDRPACFKHLRQRKRLEREHKDVLALGIAKGLQEGDDGAVGEGGERLNLAGWAVRGWRVGVDYLEGEAGWWYWDGGGGGGGVVDC